MEIVYNDSNTKTVKDIDNNINNDIDKNNMCIDVINSNKSIVNDKEICSEEENCDDSANLIDTFTNLFNFNTYLFYEHPNKKIDKKLGSIMFIYDNNKYNANYSIQYPKIIYNNEVFDNLREWVKFIKKNHQKNKIMFNFLK
jgi:hypothetical protein